MHRSWRRLLSAARGRPEDTDAEARWVVLDTETSGLDPARDHLLAIGAVAVDGQGIRIGDSFECVIRTEGVGTAANVVVHGIGHEAQRGGVPAGAALAAFATYLDGAPCIGFHAGFDRTVLARAFKPVADAAGPARWLDLEPLAVALAEAPAPAARRGLDDWLAIFSIDVVERHNAAADALATAELLLRLRALAARQGARGFAALERLAGQGRWLASGR